MTSREISPSRKLLRHACERIRFDSNIDWVVIVLCFVAFASPKKKVADIFAEQHSSTNATEEVSESQSQTEE